MTWSGAETLIALSGLLLGGSGVAAIYTFVVRPRVYMATRDYKTVRIFSEAEAPRIELTLRNQGVPLAYAELEWWNAGHRAGEDIVVELRAPAPITHWTIEPRESDIAAAWSCESDPLSNAEALDIIRIRQVRLMPKARCSLVVAYDLSPGGAAMSSVRAFAGKQIIPVSNGNGWQNGLESVVAFLSIFGPPAVTGWIAFTLWGRGTIAIGALAGVVIAIWMSRVLGPKLISAVGPGSPSWEQPKRS